MPPLSGISLPGTYDILYPFGASPTGTYDMPGLGRRKRRAAPGMTLEDLARQTVLKIFQPQIDFLKTQLADIDKSAQARAEFMRQVFAGFAEFLKGLIPETQAAYQRAASDVSAFSKAYSVGLAAAENLSAQQVGQVLATIGAPPSAAPASLDAGGKLYAVTGYLPAATLEQQGLSAARYIASLPSIYLQAGANEIAKLLAEAERQKSEIRGQLAELGTRSGQAILQELHQLRAESRAERQLDLREKELGLRQGAQSSLAWYRSKLIELRQAGLSLAQARYVAQDRARWQQRLIDLWDRNLITERSLWKLLGFKNWKSRPALTKNQVQREYQFMTALDASAGVVYTIAQDKHDPSHVEVTVTDLREAGAPPARRAIKVTAADGSQWLYTYDPRDPSHGTLTRLTEGKKPEYPPIIRRDPTTGEWLAFSYDPVKKTWIVTTVYGPPKSPKVKARIKAHRNGLAAMNAAAMALARGDSNAMDALLRALAPGERQTGQDIRGNHEAVFNYLSSIYLKAYGDLKVDSGLVNAIVDSTMRTFRLGKYWKPRMPKTR